MKKIKNKKLSIGAIVLAFMIASITNINASEIISEQSTDVAYAPTHPTNEETKNASKAISEDSRAKYSASTKAGEASTLYLSKDGYATKSDGSYWSGAGFDYVYSGDTITYDINLVNEGTEVLENIPVRDTMLEDMPSYLTLYKDIVVQDTDTHTDVPYSGSLEDGDFSVIVYNLIKALILYML
ncbi:hypothetical protein R2F61_07165 [Mollicutes bacterium LVI A0078]|nr:hypothetical protein R2F61_07165 [Mollicutes bacterium LVI A0078]